MICSLYNEQIEFIIDKDISLYNTKIIYDVSKLLTKQSEYDVIIITVLGREKEIINYLINELKITKKILTIDF